MHTKGFLHKTLSFVMQKKRFETLFILTQTVLETKQISLTELGRSMNLPIQARSGIRRVDRFLGNEKLHLERPLIIKAVVNRLLIGKVQADIIVDWTPVPNTKKHIIRAALSTTGRSLTLYEEVHDESKQANATVHRNFLRTLKDL